MNYTMKTKQHEHGELTSAYNDNDQYIGNEKFAKILQKNGIEPELSKPSHNVCSIGFCEKENKWYGWSHRAMYGFGVGSEIKKGDCGYQAGNKRDFQHQQRDFWKDEESHIWTTMNNVQDEDGVWGVEIKWRYNETIPNKKLWNKESTNFTPYPETYGKGEWKAETIEDAKQMAIDFAESVS